MANFHTRKNSFCSGYGQYINTLILFLQKKRMFSIFNKKKYLADHLEGLTDMHCHILPVIDDGAKDNAMALEMLKAYESLGYKGTIATPHTMEDYYDNTTIKIKDTLSEFGIFKNENGFSDFNVSAASEYMLDQQFERLTKDDDLLPIIGNRILVEMSYFQKPINVDNMLFDLQLKGFTPIMAHPERYQYLKGMEEILEFKKKGSELQLNLLSLGGHYGKDAQKMAFKLLEENQYEYLGTDAHKPAHFSILKKITLSRKIESNVMDLVVKTKQNLSS